tara:strand:- start:421 stop:558 length:138 start_codon:yes stop_codon:yes gene_type:complete
VINIVNEEVNKLMAGYAILIFLLKELKKKFLQKLYLDKLNKKISR